MQTPTRRQLMCHSLLAGLAAWAGPARAAADRLVRIEALLRQHLYDPALLDSAAYAALRPQLQALDEGASDDAAFLRGFNALWRSGPASHVQLQPARGDAAATAAWMDTMRVGPDAVQLRWQGDVAVLSVRTMMGQDTIDAIGTAFRELAGRPSRGLVIDLRANPGGAFAVRPLVGHLLREPLETGVFISRRGLAAAPPQRERVVAELPAWDGWSLRRFWHDVQAVPMLRIRFEPLQPHFAGPVVALCSSRTASAAELALDAMLASGRVQVFGEPTAGRMLSQMPFDLPGTPWQLLLPVADYHAWHSGRIEGRGVQPSVSLPAAKALDAALKTLLDT